MWLLIWSRGARLLFVVWVIMCPWSRQYIIQSSVLPDCGFPAESSYLFIYLFIFIGSANAVEADDCGLVSAVC